MLGDAFVVISPETAGFREKADAAIRLALAGIRPRVRVKVDAASATGFKVDADTRPALDAIRNLKERMAALSAELSELRIGADDRKAEAVIAGLQAKLLTLAKTTASITMGADTTRLDAAIAAEKARLATLIQQASDLKIDASTSAAIAKIAALDKQAYHLRDGLSGLELDVDVRAAVTKIAAIESELRVLRSNSETVRLAADSAALNAGIAAARAKIATLTAQAAKVKIGIDASGLASADAALLGLEARIGDLKEAAAKAGAATNRGLVGTWITGLPWVGRWAAALGFAANKVQLFGGAFTALTNKMGGFGRFLRVMSLGLISSIAVWHLWTEAILVTAGTLIPAALAFTAFAAVAVPTVMDITKHLQNMQTVSEATGKFVYPLTGAFQQLADAVKPKVYQLFGDALYIMGQKTGQFARLAKGAGTVVDQLANRLTTAITQGSGFNEFMAHAVKDLSSWGNLIADVLGTIGHVFSALPGYATIVLRVAQGFTHAADTAVGLVTPLLKVGLAAHGMAIYAGLAVTAAVRLGGVFGRGLTSIGSWAQRLSVAASTSERLGKAAGLAGTAMNKFGTIATRAGQIPWGWIAIAAAGIGFLIYKLATAKTATQQWIATLNASVLNTPAFRGFQVFANAQSSLTARLSQELALGAATARRFGAAMAAVTSTGGRGRDVLTDYGRRLANLTAAEKKNIAENALFSQRIARLGIVFGGTAQAMTLLRQAGLSVGDVIKAGNWANIVQQVTAAYDALRAMSQGSGQFAANMNALTLAGSDQVTAMTNLNNAWSSVIGIISGGQTAFITFEQDMLSVNKSLNQTGGVSRTVVATFAATAAAAKKAGASMTGLNAPSLQLRATWQNAFNGAAQLIGALRLMSATSPGGFPSITVAMRDTIAQMAPLGSLSKATRAELVGLAQEVDNNVTNWKQLVRWLGNTKNPAKGLNDLLAKMGVNLQDLSKDAIAVGDVMKQSVIATFTKVKFAANGTDAAVKSLADSIATGGSKAEIARKSLDLFRILTRKDGLEAHAAAALIDSLGGSISRAALITGATQDKRKALIRDMENAGFSAREARIRVDELGSAVRSLPAGKSISILMKATGNYTVTGNTIIPGPRGVSGPGFPKKAKGGMITGGQRGRDSVLAWLTPGEVVVPESDVRAGAVDHLRGRLPGFAAGGFVGTGAPGVGGLSDFTVSSYNSFQRTAIAALAAATFSALKAARASAQAAANAAAAAAAGGGGGGPAGGAAGWRGTALQAMAMLGIPAGDIGIVLSQMNTECVTIDTVILTRRGWLGYDEVQPGDETIGYNPETGQSEWTRIERVVYYPQREVWRFGNKYWSVKCTPNHRWLTEHITRRRGGQVVRSRTCPECGAPFSSWRAVQIHRACVHGTSGARHDNVNATAETVTGTQLLSLQETGLQDRIVLARTADTGTALNVTISEAALLGWIAGDGSVSEPRDYWQERVPEPVRAPSAEAPFGYRQDGQPKKNNSGRPLATGPRPKVSPLTIIVYQSKTEHFAAIDAACSADPHVGTSVRSRRKEHHRECRSWRLSAGYSRDLLARAGNPKTEAVSQVLQMSAEQRQAWLTAMISAEGTRSPGKTTVYQNDGPVADAIELAIYLSGYRPSRSKESRNDRNAWRINLTAPYVGGPDRRSFTEPAGHQDVWCVTTALGTWTARQDNQVFLTGNSGGNPRAVNLSDSNAAAGHPSVGLMQVIAGTFAAYAGGFRNTGPFAYGVSENPLANIYAGLNYAIHRYGASWTSVLGHGHGYANGGVISEPVFGLGARSGMPYSFAERGPETVIPGTGRRHMMHRGPDGPTSAQMDRLIAAVERSPGRVAAGVAEAFSGLSAAARQHSYYRTR